MVGYAVTQVREAAQETPLPVPPPPSGPEPEEPVQQTLTAAPAPWRLAGEVLNTYIIAEDGESVWLIDKHAAHERINFDRMKAGTEPIMRQQLLSSAAVDLAQEQYEVLLDNQIGRAHV